MQEELKDTIQNLLDIKLPKNYDNLHDLNFLLKLEEIGNLAKKNVETAKHDTVNNQLKTVDEVLEYIPNEQLNDYTVCPGYYYLFLDNIKKSLFRITTTQEDFRHFLNFVDSYNDPNIISVYLNNTTTGYNYNTSTFQLFFFYHENNIDFLTKLKTVNKYCDKFLVDTVNKEIHPNFYSSKWSVSEYCNNFNYICDYQNMSYKNNGLVITDNKLINKNVLTTYFKDYSNYGSVTDLFLNVTHIFDIETNQYLYSNVDRESDKMFNMFNVKEFITPSMMNIVEENEQSHILKKFKEYYRKTLVNE